MQNNIFLLRHIQQEEDFFTSALECLLNRVPELGQKIVDYLCQNRGLSESPIFQSAIDHPYFGNWRNKPDFLLRCETLDIICEHKLESNLGCNQLERYLELAEDQEQSTYLTLISNKLCGEQISDHIRSSKKYLQPQTRSHFLWQDLYPLVAEHPDQLAQDFKELMAGFGMAPTAPITGWENLFDIQYEQYSVFRSLLKDALKKPFAALGADCSLDGSGKWSYRVKYPQEAPWLHLMYIYANDENKSPWFNWEKPSLNAAIWVAEGSEEFEKFHEFGKSLQSHNGRAIQMTSNNNIVSRIKLHNPEGILTQPVASYHTNLREILSFNHDESRSAILDFALAAYEDAKKIVSN
jgi:hypothetical protein